MNDASRKRLSEWREEVAEQLKGKRQELAAAQEDQRAAEADLAAEREAHHDLQMVLSTLRRPARAIHARNATAIDINSAASRAARARGQASAAQSTIADLELALTQLDSLLAPPDGEQADADRPLSEQGDVDHVE